MGIFHSEESNPEDAQDTDDSDFEMVRTSGRLRTQRRPNAAANPDSRKSVHATTKDLLKPPNTDLDLAEELQYAIPTGFTFHQLRMSKYAPGLFSSSMSHSDMLASYLTSLRRCLYTATEVLAPARNDKVRSKKRSSTNVIKQSDPLMEQWRKMVATAKTPSRLVLDLIKSCNSVETDLLECFTKSCKKILEAQDELLVKDNVACWLELWRTFGKYFDPELLITTIFFRAEWSYVQGMAKCLDMAEMILVCVQELTGSFNETIRDQSAIVAELKALQHWLLVEVEKWAIRLRHDVDARDTPSDTVQKLLIRYRWLCFQFAQVFDVSLDEQEGLLRRCEELLHLKSIDTTLPILDEVVTFVDVAKELKNLAAEKELSTVFHNFETLQSYEQVIKQLEPVLLESSDDNDGAHLLTKRVLTKQPYDRRMALYQILYNSAMNSGHKQKAFRCLAASLHVALTEVHKVDGFMRFFVHDWDEVRQSMADYADDLAKTCAEVLKRICHIWELISLILNAHVDDIWSDGMVESEKTQFFYDAVLCLHMAWTFCLYENELNVGVGILAHNMRQLKERASRFDELTDISDADRFYACLRLSVRPWVLFFHLLVAMSRSVHAFVVVHSSAGTPEDEEESASPLDYLLFAHTQLGENGLCHEDGGLLLHTLAKEAFLWFEQNPMPNGMSSFASLASRAGDTVDMSDEFSQCFNCLYGLTIPTRKGSLVDHDELLGWKHDELDAQTASLIFTHSILPILKFVEKDADIARLKDTFTIMDKVFDGSMELAIANTAFLNINYSGLKNLLSRPINPKYDLDPRIRVPVPFSGDFNPESTSTSTHAIPICFDRYYYEKAKFYLEQIYELPTADSSSFEPVITALRNDLTFNPSRVDSWFKLGMCYLALLKQEAAEQDLDLGEILELQQSAFWCLRRCLDLVHTRDRIYHPPQQDGLESVGKKAVDGIRETLRVNFTELCALSELGHLTYSMASAPLYGMVLMRTVSDEQARKDLFGRMDVVVPSVGMSRLEDIPSVCHFTTTAPTVTERPLKKRRIDDSQPDNNADGGHDENPDPSHPNSERSTTSETKAELNLPITQAETASLIPDPFRRQLYAFSATCFVQTRKLTRHISKQLEKFRMALHALGIKLDANDTDDDTDELLSELKSRMPIIHTLDESWEWPLLLARCSINLTREPSVITRYFEQAAHLAVGWRDQSMFGLASRTTLVPVT